MKKYKTVLISLVGAGLCLALTGCGEKTVDLNDYVEVEISGYDGYGTAEVVFDYEAFEEDTADLKFSKQSNGALLYDSASAFLLDNCVNFKLSKDEELSNGDEITLKWNVQDNVAEGNTNAKFKYESIKVKVDDLKKVDTFDAFEGVNVVFTGKSPLGYATVECADDRLAFFVNPSSELANGDVVTVSLIETSATITEIIETFGAVPETNIKEYKVEGLPHYVTELSEIPDDVYQQMDKFGRELILDYEQNFFDNPEDAHSDQVKLIEKYLISADSPYHAYANSVGLIYQLEAVDADGEVFNYYWQFDFLNVLCEADGSITIDYEDCDYPEVTKMGFFNYSDLFERKGYYYGGYETTDEIIDEMIYQKKGITGNISHHLAERVSVD